MSRFYNNINTKGKFSSFIFQENNKTEIKFNQFMIFELQYENKARV